MLFDGQDITQHARPQAGRARHLPGARGPRHLPGHDACWRTSRWAATSARTARARPSRTTSSGSSRCSPACRAAHAGRAARCRAASSRCWPSGGRSWPGPGCCSSTSRRWAWRRCSSPRSSRSSPRSTSRARPSCWSSRTRRRRCARADRAYVLETGRIVKEGAGDELLDDEAVQAAYLGGDVGTGMKVEDLRSELGDPIVMGPTPSGHRPDTVCTRLRSRDGHGHAVDHPEPRRHEVHARRQAARDDQRLSAADATTPVRRGRARRARRGQPVRRQRLRHRHPRSRGPTGMPIIAAVQRRRRRSTCDRIRRRRCRTRVTDLLGVRYPIVQAPMGWIARAQLASAVSDAGGLGIIETSSGELDAVRDEIRKMRDLTDKPFGVNIAQLFVRDPASSTSSSTRACSFVTTSRRRSRRSTPRQLKAAGLTVFHVVPTLAAALQGGRRRRRRPRGRGRRGRRLQEPARRRHDGAAAARVLAARRAGHRRRRHLRRPVDGGRLRPRRRRRADGHPHGVGRRVARARQLEGRHRRRRRDRHRLPQPLLAGPACGRCAPSAAPGSSSRSTSAWRSSARPWTSTSAATWRRRSPSAARWWAASTR